MADNEALVLVEPRVRKRGFLGFLGGRPPVPAIKAGMRLFVSTHRPDGSSEFRQILPAGSSDSAELPEAALFYHISSGACRFAPAFSALIKDGQGHSWDGRLVGRISIKDARRFLDSFAAGMATPNAPLTAALAESWIANRIAPNVRDAVSAYSLEDLRDKQALPPAWWEKQVSAWLDDFGIAVRVEEVSWSSAQAAAAEAEAARRHDLERVAQAQQKEQEVQLREAATKAEYEQRKRQIENDQNLSAQESANQLQLLEKRHRKELIEADTQIENARREAEKAALEHERQLARLRQDTAAVQQAQERSRQAEVQHTAALDELRGLTATLAKLADLPDNLLAKLADRDAAKANAAAERVVSPEFGVSAAKLSGLGFPVERQNLVESLRQRAAADGHKVSIRKAELITRDIGTARVKGLPINTSLQFEFTTGRAGYVTLLNIGTSGNIYLHVPNAYVALEQTRVASGRSYAIPGPEFLPWERLRQLGFDYVEVGPPGWEHLVVLVSDKPLIAAHTLARAVPENPFVQLTGGDIAELCLVISNEPADAWSAGVLSFLVA